MVFILFVFIFILSIEFELIEKGIITMTIGILVPVICCLEISVAFRGLIFYILTVRIFLFNGEVVFGPQNSPHLLYFTQNFVASLLAKELKKNFANNAHINS